MPSKLQFYEQMADHTAEQITRSFQNWTAFLDTAARLYKYPYHEQLMIFAQRPEATACAEYDLWNKQMRRYVRRGSKGIALIDTAGDNPKLKYVFDVSDTGGLENSRRPYLWEYRQEHKDSVDAALERRFGVSGEKGLEEQVERIATQLINEFWDDHGRDILGIVDDSFLEEYDEFNIEAAFQKAAVVSTTYAILSRCGMDSGDYFEHEDFLNVFDFNTPRTIAALGTAISQSSEQVLRQIEVTIKNYERMKIAERSENHERTDLHAERGLPDSRSESEQNRKEILGQVRQDAEGLPEEAASGAVEQTAAVRGTVPPSVGDRRNSEPETGADDARTDEVGGRDGGTESQRPDEVDRADGHPQGTGRGDNSERTGVQLNQLNVPAGEQLSFFPTEAEQIQIIAEAESVTNTPFAFSFAQDDIDDMLRLASNSDHTRMVVAAAFQEQKPMDDIVTLLRKEYHGGAGMKSERGEFSVWYAEDGIHLAKGRTARYVGSAQVISWEAAAERISQLMDEGKYATNVELAEAELHERTELSHKLWNIRGDLSDEAKEQNILGSLQDYRRGGFPDDTARLSEALKDPAFRRTLSADYTAFMDAYKADRNVMRFHYHKPVEIWNALQDLDLPRREYTSDMAEVPKVGMFITEDEIDATLNRGSDVEGGKGRIYTYLTGSHNSKEKADFLKNEYGQGGSSHAVSGQGWIDSSGKGIRLQKPDCADVKLNWNQVAKRIDELIRKGRYMTQEALAEHEAKKEAKMQEVAGRESIAKPATEAQEIVQQPPAFLDYNDIKQAHPDDVVLYQVGVFFEMYGEDAKIAAEALELHLTSRSIPDVGRVAMCGIPAHALAQYVEQLRESYGVTIAATQDGSAERKIYSLAATSHEPVQTVSEAEQAQPTIREQYERYKPTVMTAVTEDTPYRNACGHSDRENAVIEGNAAVRRAILGSGDLELIRLYSDVPEFRNRLHQEVIDETYPRLHELLRPLSQDDIDDALRTWNGSGESKNAVVRYMEQHGREKDTAAWLSHEYGGDENKNLFIVRAGSPETTELTWAKVQRRIAQLIKEDRFLEDWEKVSEPRDYSPEYRLLSRLHTDCEYFLGEGRRSEKHLWAGNVRTQITKMRELYDMLPDKPEWLTSEAIDSYADRMAPPYLVVAYHHFENGFDEKRDYQTLEEAEKAAQGYVDGTMESDGFAYDGAAVYDKQEQKYLRIYGDYPDEKAHAQVETHTKDSIIPAEPVLPVAKHDPLAPPYKVGDTVYLDDTAFEITEINVFDIQLRDPMLYYPIFRSESKAQFERLLQQDNRNGGITEFLPAELDITDTDLQDVLTGDGGLLAQRDKEIISRWFRNGEGNKSISHRMSETYAGTVETMTLLSGEEADFRATTVGLEIEIQDKFNTKLSFHWDEIVPVLRAMYRQERDGFYHEPVLQEPVTLEGIPAYKVGDSVVVPYPDRDIKGTIGYIGDIDVRIDTGPYSWSHETINREQFENFIRHDERNAHLFTPEVSAEKDNPRGNSEYFRYFYDYETDQVDAFMAEHPDYHKVWGSDSQGLNGGTWVVYRNESDLPAFLREYARNQRLADERTAVKDEKEPSPEITSETVATYPGDDTDEEPDLDKILDESPISVQMDGEWRTFPNAAAAEDAMYEESKAEIRRNAQNFHITDDNLGIGGAKAKFRMNMDAINLLKELEIDGRQATPEEQAVLAKYVGWGGLADAFDETKDNWKNEFAELYATLSPEEYAAARSSTLNAHYTSPTVIKAIYEAVGNMGFQTGNILDK